MAYFDKYGVEFSDDRKTLVMFPQNFKGAYVIPEGVTDFETYTEVDGEDLPVDVYVEYSPFTYQPLKRHAISCCPGLTSLEFPSSLTVIPEKAFQGCCSLETVIFHAKELTIEDYAFDGCEKLENVIIETDDIHIGSNVFRETQFIKSHCIDGALYLHDTVIFVDSAYQGTFVVKEGTKRLGKRVFAYIDGITEVVLPKSLEDLGVESFSNCGIRKICIPEGITEIPDGGEVASLPDFPSSFCKGGVFCKCENLEEVVLPTSLKEIGIGAFYGCTKLSTINIPQGVQRIGMFAFEWTGLYSISIKNPSVIIENGAFANCLNLNEVKFDEFSSPQFVFVSEEEFGCDEELSPKSVFANCENLPVINNIRYAGVYLVEAVDKELSTYVIKDDTKYIGAGAFRNCCSIKTITIPDSVISIGEGAFEKCEFLNSIIIPDNVTKIGSSAFCDCSNLTSVTIGNGVTDIESYAFCNCSSLTSVSIGNGVENIRKSAFSGCSNLKSLSIPNNVTTIEEDVFYGCEDLNTPIYNAHIFAYLPRSYSGTYVIPEGVEYITNDAFSNCNYLTSIVIPFGVKSIGDSAFGRCENLTSINIPDSVINIGWNVFYGCDALKTPLYNAHIFAYMPRTHTGNYVIPNGIKTIANHAFYRCDGVTSITIPNSVKCIDNSAFSACYSLKEICIPKGQKARFLQIGLDKYEDIIVERDNEELTILLNLAKAYELGIGLSQSIAQSVLIYTQAAEKGSAEAAYRLAEWYQNGEVLPLDLNKALDLYQQAAKSGYKDAEEKAQRIQQKIEAEEKKQADYLAEKQKEQETKAVVEAQAIPYYLFFDTETAGVPPKGMDDVPVTNPDFWPRLVQLAWILTDKEGRVLNCKSKIIYPNGFSIPASATAVHHITTEHAMQVGEPLRDVLGEFMKDLLQAEKVVGHSVKFDQHIVGAELYSMDMDYKALMNKTSICTKLVSTNFCALPNTNGHSGYKWPSLPELYQILFGRDFENAHDALADITATKDCFFELKRRGIIRE